MKKIAVGAEATVFKEKIFSKDIIIKERSKKKYRNLKLDEKIRKTRNKSETYLLKKAKSLKLNTPYILYVGKYKIIMENIKNTNKHKEYLSEIGKEIAKLHNNNIIHGDLNLINIITNNNKIYFIDFGLGFISNKIEDKATDLLVFKKTLFSLKQTDKFWNEIINAYREKINNKNIIFHIKNIENRGRYL